MSTPSIPGVDRDDLADVIVRGTVRDGWTPARAADAALAYIAARHECACDREHADDWVEVDEDTWRDLPTGTRVRTEWEWWATTARRFIHRDDLPNTTKTEGEPMSPANENATVVTDRDRTPDPVATIKPFRHPWIAGDDSCGECGYFFHEHWWADAGDHGHTVCRLPEPDEVWVEVDEATWSDRPEGARIRQEWMRGFIGGSRYFVHRDDLPDPDADAANALRDASWNVPRLADGSRPDPLPGLPEARGLLAALREHGWTVARKGDADPVRCGGCRDLGPHIDGCDGGDER